MMTLESYNKKRNFEATTEPKGMKQNSKNNRFVVQYHQARTKHFDFRLEFDGVLISWAIPKGLSQNPKDKRLSVKVEDHPISYIDFQGIIPKGNYGAGTVEVFDFGKYVCLGDMEKGLKKGHIKIVLNGNKLKGAWDLIKTHEDNWLAIKSEDEFAEKYQKTKKTKLPFQNTPVQLATLCRDLPKGRDWIYEIKYDGYRIVAYLENGKVKLMTRNNLDYSNKFTQICKGLQKLECENCVLDGELVAFDKNGRSDFGLLQENLKQGKGEFYYVIFDLLAFNGQDLREEKLLDRKSKLERVLYKCENCLIYSSHVFDGEACFEFAKQHQLEGIIAKKNNSKYLGKRTEDWLKFKCYRRQEFVVAGYSTTERNEILSAILLGVYVDKNLRYVGKVGTGLSERVKKKLVAEFKPNIRKNSPFKEGLSENDVVWLTPKFVAEVQFSEFTKEGLLRQASFIGLRYDKNPKTVKLEEMD